MFFSLYNKNFLGFFSCGFSFCLHMGILCNCCPTNIPGKRVVLDVSLHQDTPQKVLDIVFAQDAISQDHSFPDPKKEPEKNAPLCPDHVELPHLAPSVDPLLREEPPLATEKWYASTNKSQQEVVFAQDRSILPTLFAIDAPRWTSNENLPERVMREPEERSTNCHLPAPPLALSAEYMQAQLVEKEVCVDEYFAPISWEQAPLAPFASLYELGALTCKEQFSTTPWQEAFVVDVDCYEKASGKIVFAVTFFPKPHMHFEKLPQDIYYLIDKSNAIQEARLKATKNAVNRSLSYLSDEDRFNLVAFDHRLELFSGDNQTPNLLGKKRAREFLQHLQLGSLFSSSEPYRALYSVLQGELSSRPTTVILITNGEGLGKRSERQQLIGQLSRYNQGRFPIFCLAMDGDEDLPSLERLSLFNQGSLYVSHTKGGLKRKLSKLLKAIEHPIAERISLHACARNHEQQIVLSHQPSLPRLYKGVPFLVMGETNSMDDFTLFLHGKAGEKSVQIRAEISLKKASLAGPQLANQWAFARALEAHQQFFLSGEEHFFQKALALVEEHQLEEFFP